MSGLEVGGMQSAQAVACIYCERCGKPAARKDTVGKHVAYMHFTKAGAVWHIWDGEAWSRRRKGPEPGGEGKS